MYKPLSVLRPRRIFHRLPVLDIILYQIVRRLQQCGGTVIRQEEGGWVIRIPDGDVPVRVEDVVFVENVRGRDQAPEEVVEVEVVAVLEVAGGHYGLVFGLILSFLLDVCSGECMGSEVIQIGEWNLFIE
jgi:hypothetical protein